MVNSSNTICENKIITKISNKVKIYGPDLVGSTIIFFIGSYTVSQNTIPSYIKDSYSPIKWYIIHPENAWTSILYALPKTPLLMKLPLMTLAIASFGLWANSTSSINFIDVTSIYWVILTTTIYSMPYAKHKTKIIWLLNSGTTLFIGSSIYNGYHVKILDYYNENIVPFTGMVNVLCCVLLYPYYLNNINYNIGIFCVICGYICKLQTIYHDAYWGTSVFHVLTALGIHILLYMEKPSLKFTDKNVKKSNSMVIIENL